MTLSDMAHALARDALAHIRRLEEIAGRVGDDATATEEAVIRLAVYEYAVEVGIQRRAARMAAS